MANEDKNLPQDRYFASSAVLLWIPAGSEPPMPSEGRSDAEKVQGFWLLSQAIETAISTSMPGFEPWAKAGEAMYDLADMKNLQTASREFERRFR